VSRLSKTRNNKVETSNMEAVTTEVVATKPTAIITNESGLMMDSSDIDIPRINLVQKTSDINAPVGSVVVDKKHVLLKPDEPAEVVVLAAIKGWREDIPYDDDGIPRIAYTPEDMQAIAAQSDYDMLEFAEITLMFKQPEGSEDEEAYPFPIGDHQYAIGKINVAKDAYRQTYKRLATFAAFNKSVPLQNKLWNFESSLMTKGKYSWYAPSLSTTQKQPDAAVLEFTANFSR
jgi:hypothetical protein